MNKITNIEMSYIRDLIRDEIKDKSMVSFRELFGNKSKYPSWEGTPLMPLYEHYGEEVGAQMGGRILKDILMREQKNQWESIKQAFSGRKDDNEVLVYFRSSR